MNRLIKHIAFVLLLLVGSIARTQTYPVQAFVQVSPPYNSYLPDYADPFTNQMKVLLTLTDFAIPSTQVKLRFKIEGPGYSMQSVDLIAFPTITLTPGMPVEISGSALAPYLATENFAFSGLSPEAYELSKILPEGPATICVEVVDVTSAGQPIVGNPACGQAWFSLYDPPLLNLPFCGTELTITDPQTVLFSWTPLHMASPHAGMTEYVFELFEIRPEMMDPNVVVETSLPIYTETTINTFVNYGIVQPILVTGMSYVWRVKARDPSGRDLYRNSGHSAVCTFTWGSIAGELIDGIALELNSNGTGVRQGLAWWNASDLFDNYILEVRKTGNPAYEWFPYTAEVGELKVNSLEPETEYECRVKGVAGGAETDWSEVSTFTTQPPLDYACGSTSLPAVSPLNQPLDFLIPGNIVATGQFEMTVTSAEPLPFPGHFRGRGKVKVPFIYSNFNVEFEDIYIDEDMVMREGRVDVITEGVDAWIEDFGNVYIPGIIDPGGFDFSGDTIVTVHFGDESLTFDFRDADPFVFIDESGLVYTVYLNGTIDVGGAITWDDDDLAATADHVIHFHAYEEQTYGFDEKEHLQWQLNYPCIKLTDNSLYFIPYKSVGSGNEDIVVATITSAEGVIAPQFKYPDGTVLASTRINDSTYHVTAGNVATSKIIYAYDDLGAKIGKTFLSIYVEKIHNVVIVPVNGATVPAELETSLNTTFAQANMSFEVTQVANYENDTYDSNSNGLESPDATLMQKYSLEMRSLRDAYFDEFDKENDTYYVFVVPEFDSPLDGYMVRGKAIGYIASNQTTHTYAHELAHGAFGLEHTFPSVPLGTTENLLDYTAEGNHLTHEQWYDMQHFTPVFSFLDDEEDGSMISLFFSDDGRGFYKWSGTEPYDFYDFDSFYTPGGSILKIESVASLDSICFDALTGGVQQFKYNEHVFRGIYSKPTINGVKFLGYFRSDYFTVLRELYAKQNPIYLDLEEDLTFTTIENAALLKDHPELYFTNYSNGSNGDIPIGIASTNDDDCLISVYKWTNNSSGVFPPTLNASDEYNYPLRSTLNSLTIEDIKDKNSEIIDGLVLGTEIPEDVLEVLCQLTQIYDKPIGWARNFIDGNLVANDHENIYDFGNHHFNYVKSLLDIAVGYNEFGFELLDSYEAEINDISYLENIQDALFSVFWADGDYDYNYPQPENAEDFVEVFVDKLNVFRNRITALNKTSDVSILITVISYLSAEELNLLDYTLRKNLLSKIIENDASEVIQLVRLIEYSDDQEHFFTYTVNRIESHRSNSNEAIFLSQISIDLLSELTYAQKLNYLGEVISDDGTWVYKYNDRNLLLALFNSASTEEKNNLLNDGFRDDNWFQIINDQLYEWFDIDDADYYAVTDLFVQLSNHFILNPTAVSIIPEMKTVSYMTSVEYLPPENVRSAIYSDAPRPDFSNKIYTQEFERNAFPILIGSTIGDFKIADSPDGEYGYEITADIEFRSEYALINIVKDVPYELTNNRIEVAGNYVLKEKYVAEVVFDPENPFDGESEILANTDDYTLDPFEMVEVIFTSNYGGAGFGEGESMLIPAFELMLIKKAISMQKTDYLTRLTIDAIEITAGVFAGLTSPFTAGGSLALFTGVVASIDAYVIAERETFSPELYNSYYATWDNIKLASDIIAGVAAMPSLYRVGKKILRKSQAIYISYALNRNIRKTVLPFTENALTIRTRAAQFFECIRLGEEYDALALFFKVADDLANTVDDLAGAWITGWNKQKVLDLPKGSRPNPSTYLDQSYIDNHIAKFDQEGGAFIAVKSWIEGGNYTQFPVKKYAMLKSDMQNALSKYKQTGNVNDIEDALGYARGDLAGLEDELFVFYPDKTKFNFELPDGNEIGANNLWEPGGKTSGGYREAVLIDNANPSTPISHNKSIESLKNQFNWEKL